MLADIFATNGTAGRARLGATLRSLRAHSFCAGLAHRSEPGGSRGPGTGDVPSRLEPCSKPRSADELSDTVAADCGAQPGGRLHEFPGGARTAGRPFSKRTQTGASTPARTAAFRLRSRRGASNRRWPSCRRPSGRRSNSPALKAYRQPGSRPGWDSLRTRSSFRCAAR